MNDVEISDLFLQFNAGRSRLILLDYDGTLTPLVSDPRQSTVDPAVKKLLVDLTEDPRNQVVLISGREREYLDLAWGDVPITLVAEHGGYYKSHGSPWTSLFSDPPDWVPKTLPSIRSLAFYFDGSYVEEKSYSIAWHYRAISDRIQTAEKRQILAALRALPEHSRFFICDSDMTIELRTPGVNKGSFVSRWIGTRMFDFIMAIGDGLTDEDLFMVLPDDSFSIKVGGAGETAARFRLADQADVTPLLTRLLQSGREFRNSMVWTGLDQFR